MAVSLQGPMAGAVMAVIGLYLLFAPIELLARKPSPVKRRRPLKKGSVPLWMKIFFRTLGLLMVAFGGLLAAPLFGGS